MAAHESDWHLHCCEYSIVTEDVMISQYQYEQSQQNIIAWMPSSHITG